MNVENLEKLLIYKNAFLDKNNTVIIRKKSKIIQLLSV